jgi:hypothetical protein
MRQVMPHRNNIGVESPACKSFLGWLRPSGTRWRDAHDPPETGLGFRSRITPIESISYVSRSCSTIVKPQLSGIAVMLGRHNSRSLFEGF